MSDFIEALKQIYPFEYLDEKSLASFVEKLTKKVFIAGDAIFNQGDKASCFYYLKKGTVKIEKWAKENEQVVATICAGSILGEMSFLTSSPRTATARAQENVEVIEIPFGVILDKTKSDPVFGHHLYKAFAENLCRRIESTTNDLTSLKELKIRHT